MRYIPKTMVLAVLGAGILSPVASSQGSLTTTFASNGGYFASGAGNLFDVEVKNAKGLKITSFDVNSLGSVKANLTLDVYITPITYIGVDVMPRLWVKVATGTGLLKGRDTPTPIDTSDFFLAPGKYGMYVVYTNPNSLGVGPAYTNGNSTNQKYSNSDLALELGITRSAPFGGSRFAPRVWNGTIYYQRDDQAANGPHGFGCPGTGGIIPEMSLDKEPKLGASVTISVKRMVNVPLGTVFLFLGAISNRGIDLALINMPNCRLFTDPVVITFGLANRNGSASLTQTIPASASLIGSIVGLQAANVDAGANALGVAATAGQGLRAGN